jgi:hypothetical protein
MRRNLEFYRNTILNLWAAGRTATEIAERLGNSPPFKSHTIQTFVDRARAAGDRRASRRRKRILNHGTDLT